MKKEEIEKFLEKEFKDAEEGIDLYKNDSYNEHKLNFWEGRASAFQKTLDFLKNSNN